MYSIHKILFTYARLIKKSDIEKIEISDDNVIMTSRDLDIKIVCQEGDERIPPIEILNFNHYEKNDTKIIHRLIKNSDVVLDIGANIGWHSIGFSKFKKNIKVFAFEPIPQTYKILLENIKINKIRNITPFNFGLYDKNTTLIFYYHPTGSGNASSKNLNPERKPIKIKSKVFPLDLLVEKVPMSKINFIKCDVEGAELFVFKGAEKSISKFKPIIFTELLRKWSKSFGYGPNDVVSLLKKYGYRCFISNQSCLKEIKSITDKTIETNFFFLHENKHRKQISMLCTKIH